MPHFLSEIFSSRNALKYGGVCCDYGGDLNWTRAVTDEHELVSIWVCPPDLDHICQPLWQSVEFLFDQKPDAVPHWQLLAAVYGKFIRRACIVGESKLDHAAIWSHFYTGLVARSEEWEEPSAYVDSLTFHFIKANELIKEMYGLVFGKHEGELWSAIDGFVSDVIEGMRDGIANNSIILTRRDHVRSIKEEVQKSKLDKPVRIHRITDSAVFLLRKRLDRGADYIELNWLSELSPQSAKYISEFPCDVLLDGLKSISPEVASQLKNRNPALKRSDARLNELLEMEGSSMDALTLSLNGIVELCDESAANLLNTERRLSLLGLDRISDEGARSLAKVKELNVSLDKLPESAAEILRAADNWPKKPDWLPDEPPPLPRE